MDPSTLTLTFGIELEFYFKINMAKYINALGFDPLIFNPDNNAQRSYLRNKFFKDAAHNEMMLILSDAGYVAGWLNIRRPQRAWLVTGDSSIILPNMSKEEAKEWVYVCAELTSPILPFCLDSLQEVTEVVELLTSKYELSTNASCGFHVHVGNHDQGFPLQTLKNFYTLAAAFEYQIHSIHPPARLYNRFCACISAILPNMQTSAKAFIIAEVRSVEDFVTLLTNPQSRYTAYNFMGLYTGPFRTIEFRQHAGTLNVAAITSWVQFVCGMIAYAHSASTDTILSLVDQVIENPDMEFAEFLEKLDMRHLAGFYADRVNKHKRLPFQLVELKFQEEEERSEREERISGLERQLLSQAHEEGGRYEGEEGFRGLESIREEEGEDEEDGRRDDEMSVRHISTVEGEMVFELEE